MPRKIFIIDTTVLCCYLRVPGKDTAGPQTDIWNYQRIESLITAESSNGSLFVLPLATLIETGNHIAKAPSQRYELATRLSKILLATTAGQSPWAAFNDQSLLWDRENLSRLSKEWPNLAAGQMSLGDATIKDVAEYYAKIGSYDVKILTGDAGLKAYEPVLPVTAPRRRG